MRKPSGYWTKERCLEEALKYNSRVEIRKGCLGAYKSIKRNGWSEELFSHMEYIQKPKGYWTKERCLELALNYNSRAEFTKQHYDAYRASKRAGWLDEICSHMEKRTWKVDGWNKEECRKEALKYDNRGEFWKKSSGASAYAQRNGFLDEICSHMKERFMWTKEGCLEVALKYDSRGEFQLKQGACYQGATRNGWIDEVCSHMVPVGSRYERCIYACEFPDKSVYIGLTYNFKKRMAKRKKDERDTVTLYNKKTGLEYKEIQLTDYIDRLGAKDKEGEYVDRYKSEGWTILNKAKTGGLGSCETMWTYEICKEEALKYETRGELRKGRPSCYGTISKRGWLDDLCSHTVVNEKRKLPNYWTYEICKEEALKYETRGVFAKKSGSCYNLACTNGWLDNICGHMKQLSRPANYWNKENVMKHARECNSRSEFSERFKRGYIVAMKNGWLDEICSHMKPKTLPKQSIEDLFE
jgi:hypothetical protein